MVDQLTLQTIGILLTGLTVSIAAIYYTLTLRYTRRNQELTLKAQEQALETRQAQLFTQIFLRQVNTQFLSDYFEVLNWEWEDYGDFEMKYGSDNNLQGTGKRIALWAYFNMIGKLLREGFVSLDLVYTLIGTTSIFQWTKWKDVIEEQRGRYYSQDFMAEWEYLYNELMKHKEELGYSWEPPATLGRYIPDK